MTVFQRDRPNIKSHKNNLEKLDPAGNDSGVINWGIDRLKKILSEQNDKDSNILKSLVRINLNK